MDIQSSIPKWNSQGVLPPTLSDTGSHRSPYTVSSLQLVDRFATTKERCDILSGLFQYRKALHNAGIVSGFQWLNGSFMEQVEVLEGRAPNDIDVVNFLDLQNIDQTQLTQEQLELFNNEQALLNYKVDSFLVEIGQAFDEQLAHRVAYWYSMWSHRRNGLWKGFLQVNLDAASDNQAEELLKQTMEAL